ncbi:MAG: hypothetical protein ABJG15_07555 [Hyphomonadaceae bacterium]
MNTNEILEFANAHRETAVAVLSALVALCGAFLASRETRKQRSLMEETLRQRLDGASIRWGDEAIEALAAAESLEHHEIHADAKADRILAAQRLSALADRGRLFFPNYVGANKGDLKEAAFRGSRPPILDALIFAHFELVSVKDGDKIDVDFLRRCRRLVVSELQDHLDPRHWDSVIERGATKKPQDHTDAERRASTLRAELTSRRIDYFEKKEQP